MTATTTSDRLDAPASRPVDALHRRLAAEAADRHATHMHRRLHAVSAPGRLIERHGRRLVNLSSNDYLGLSTHPHVVEAVREAAATHGVGSGASPLAGGHTEATHRLERRLAEFKHAEAAVLLPTGFAANLALLTTLARPGDLIAADALNHASLVDAARLSGAALRTYPHATPDDLRGLDKLARLLDRHASDPKHADACRFVVTDAVFSMDGDLAPLPELAEVAERFAAYLLVDEAHATGLLGRTGAGLIEATDTAHRVTAANTTASKALGGLGGAVTASATIIDAIVNRARPLIYSTAPPPTQVAAIDAALDVVANEPQRRHRLAEITARVRQAAALPPVPADRSTPIVPLVVGAPAAALSLAKRLAHAGFLAPAIRPPTVKPGSSRVRLSLRADLTNDDIDRLVAAIASSHPGR
ncbi:MAG: 8-amino-7-oxononanoate synthase [Planctomycetota bacterium]